MRAAEAGRRVVVLTIDPARRLAQSLGLGELDNTPRPVTGLDTTAGGSLDAMMLDMKRTFDEVVLTHSPPDKAQTILANPFYVALSSSFSGTQEYMAMERLGQLHAQASADAAAGRPAWDLIVVDTPPARSALDFLDAPEHLSSLLDGRFIRLLLAPAKGPLRLMGVGFTLVSNAMDKVLGSSLITDVQTFVRACEAIFGGFRQRAEETFARLSSRHTVFLVVATAQRDALREASYFVDRLTEEQMPLAGLVVNRVHGSALDVSAAAGGGPRRRPRDGCRRGRRARARGRGPASARRPDARGRGGGRPARPLRHRTARRPADQGPGPAQRRDRARRPPPRRRPHGRQGLRTAAVAERRAPARSSGRPARRATGRARGEQAQAARST